MSKLMEQLEEISKNQWFGLPYSTFHHPRFSITGTKMGDSPAAQRNTKERFEKAGITTELLKDKSVLDIGCNTGAVLLHARMLGAGKVAGIDNHKPNIEFCQRLFTELSEENFIFLNGNIDTISLKDLPVDIIFCLALSKWVDYDHLIKQLSESSAELIWFEDNNHMGEVIPNIIPGYDCEFKWFSGPEANTNIGWKRVNYLCRRIK